jgi:hypothetical protein
VRHVALAGSALAPADAEAEIRQWSGAPHLCRLEGDTVPAGYGEQPHAVTQQNWGKVDDDFVEQLALDALLRKVGTEDAHVLASSSLLRARDRSLDLPR